MKKAIILLLVGGLFTGAASAAHAADIKAKGIWHNAVSFANRSFEKDDAADRMQAATRLRTQIDVIASESLKGVVYFEIGPQNWGRASDGAALGNDGKVVKVRYSYVDWTVPHTSGKVRVGLQNFTLPSFALPNVVLGGGSSDGAGITLSAQIAPHMAASLFWMRAENDNASGDYAHHYSDAMDFAGLTLPVTFDGVKVTPWAMYGFIGRDSFENAGSSSDQKKLLQGLLPLGVSNKTLTGNRLTDRHGNAWWAGFTTELRMFEPFRCAVDATYGRVDLGDGLNTHGDTVDVKREGYLLSALAEYKMKSVTPGLTFWYGSGDDANFNNGSERLPTVHADVKVTSYGFDGTTFGRAQQVLGTSVDGTWGIVAHLKDISFFESLRHVVRVGYYQGTNNTENVRQNMISKPSETVSSMFYMTTGDRAWEANIDSEYKIYKNLSLFVELGYIRMDLDENLWKKFEARKDNLKGSMTLRYTF